jgi:hypothetical protein
MTMTHSGERRQFLKSAIGATGALAGVPALSSLNRLVSHGRPPAGRGHGGYGPLFPAADHEPLGDRWDRITLFANRQGDTSGSNPPGAGNEGLTFAIWGPWREGAL